MNAFYAHFLAKSSQENSDLFSRNLIKGWHNNNAYNYVVIVVVVVVVAVAFIVVVGVSVGVGILVVDVGDDLRGGSDGGFVLGVIW